MARRYEKLWTSPPGRGPAGFVLLPAAAHGQGIGGHIFGDHRGGGDERAVAKRATMTPICRKTGSDSFSS